MVPFFFWFALAMVGLLGAAACALAAATLTARSERGVADAMAMRIGRHGIWVGAWLVSIPARKKAEVTREARVVAERRESPEQIVAIWRGAGARVIAHVPGPETASPQEACAWLRRAADELAEQPTAGISLPDDDAPFALVYVRSAPPITTSRRFEDVTRAVLGGGCLGAAFIACGTSARAAAPARAALYSLRIAVWAFVAATVALVVVAFAVSAPQPRDGQTERGAAVAPSHGVKTSTSEPVAVLPTTTAANPLPAAITPPAATTPQTIVAPTTTKPPAVTTTKPGATTHKTNPVTPPAGANGDPPVPVPPPAPKPSATTP